jgi:hypothetical protein
LEDLVDEGSKPEREDESGDEETAAASFMEPDLYLDSPM